MLHDTRQAAMHKKVFFLVGGSGSGGVPCGHQIKLQRLHCACSLKGSVAVGTSQILYLFIYLFIHSLFSYFFVLFFFSLLPHHPFDSGGTATFLIIA